jgi:MFS family permease
MDVPGDKKKRRLITTIFFFISGIITASWSSRIPDVQHKLHMNNAVWGTVLFALPAGLVTGLVLSSWLVARFGTQKVMITTSILVAVLLCFLGLSSFRAELMIALFLTGFVRTILNVSMNTYAVELQQEYSRPVMAGFHGTWSAACFIAAGIGTLMIIRDVRPAFHFFIIAGICLLSVLLVSRWIGPSNYATPAKRPFLVKPDRYLLLLGIMAFCGMIGENTMFDWGISYFEKIVKVERSMVTLGYTSFIISMTLGRFFGDRLIHRFGYFTMLKINATLMGLGFMLAVFLPSLPFALIGFLLIGLGDSILVPVLYTLASRSGKLPPAYAIASVTFIGYMGFLSGPLIVGFISEAIGMQWAFGMIGAMAFCIGPLTGLLNHRFHRFREDSTEQDM